MDPITFTLDSDHGLLAGTWTLTETYLTRNGESYAPGKAIAVEPPQGIFQPNPVTYHGDTVIIRALNDRLLQRDRALVERYLLLCELVQADRITDWPYTWE